MEELNPSTNKKASGLKAFFGAVSALGIFASLIMLGNSDFQAIDKLKAELVSSDQTTDLVLTEGGVPSDISDQVAEIDAIEGVAPNLPLVPNSTATPAITSFDPTSGEEGDLIYITVENLTGFSEETSGVFFGTTPATIDAMTETTIVVAVPQISEVGSYPLRVVTTTGAIESAEQFEFVVRDNAITPDLNTENIGTPVEISVNPPSGLKAVSTPKGISLTWEGDAQSYNIYYGSQSGSYIHRVSSENLDEVIAENLQSGEVYFFVVSAVDATGNQSTSSNEVSAIFTLSQESDSFPSFHTSSPKPPKLSEEGPAETLLVSFLLTTGISIFIFRKKIFGLAE
jgi:hypothetical protein